MDEGAAKTAQAIRTLAWKRKRGRNAVRANGPAQTGYRRSGIVDACVELRGVLTDGMWAGQPAFIIGGGPSLKGLDLYALQGQLTIGVNRAYELLDPCILHTMDSRFVRWVRNGQYGRSSLRMFNAGKATKVFLIGKNRTLLPDGFAPLPCSGSDAFGWTLKDGLCGHNNSGFGAMALACILEANPIYLLGFDMKGVGGRQAWFHNGYPFVQNADVYKDQFKPIFDRYAPAIADKGVEVINLNPESALEAFPKADPGDVFAKLPKPSRPVVAGFYTIGTGYEAEAKAMIASAHRFGLETDVLAIDTLGGWQKNTQHKARVMRDMVAKYRKRGRTVLYTDADSGFLRYPAYLDDLNVPVAARTHITGERLSGTIFFNPADDRVADLMDLWVTVCDENPGMWDQRCFAIALENGAARLTS